MAITTKEILKTYFQTGDIPTQEEFYSLIDSFQDVLTINTNDLKITPIAGGGAMLSSVLFDVLWVTFYNNTFYFGSKDSQFGSLISNQKACQYISYNIISDTFETFINSVKNNNYTVISPDYLVTDDIMNNLTTIVEGKVLDARQGAVINEKMQTLENKLADVDRKIGLIIKVDVFSYSIIGDNFPNSLDIENEIREQLHDYEDTIFDGVLSYMKTYGFKLIMDGVDNYNNYYRWESTLANTEIDNIFLYFIQLGFVRYRVNIQRTASGDIAVYTSIVT